MCYNSRAVLLVVTIAVAAATARLATAAAAPPASLLRAHMRNRSTWKRGDGVADVAAAAAAAAAAESVEQAASVVPRILNTNMDAWLVTSAIVYGVLCVVYIRNVPHSVLGGVAMPGATINFIVSSVISSNRLHDHEGSPLIATLWCAVLAFVLLVLSFFVWASAKMSEVPSLPDVDTLVARARTEFDIDEEFARKVIKTRGGTFPSARVRMLLEHGRGTLQERRNAARDFLRQECVAPDRRRAFIHEASDSSGDEAIVALADDAEPLLDADAAAVASD